jgi:outer membrane biosynthesis protein TonB
VYLQGADFGAQARKAIEQKLRKGQSVEEIEWRLKHPGQDYNPAAIAAAQQAPPKPKEAPKQQQKQQQQPKQEQQQQQKVQEQPPPPPPPKAAAPPAPVEVGQSMVQQKRDPLKLIKVGVGAVPALNCVCTHQAQHSWPAHRKAPASLHTP